MLGQEIKVTLEMKDGTVFSGTALMASINMERDVLAYADDEPALSYGHSRWDMELRGIGKPLMTFENYAQEIKGKQAAPEWACDWCEGVNLKKARRCENCGAHRSFVFDLGE